MAFRRMKGVSIGILAIAWTLVQFNSVVAAQEPSDRVKDLIRKEAIAGEGVHVPVPQAIRILYPEIRDLQDKTIGALKRLEAVGRRRMPASTQAKALRDVISFRKKLIDELLALKEVLDADADSVTRKIDQLFEELRPKLMAEVELGSDLRVFRDWLIGNRNVLIDSTVEVEDPEWLVRFSGGPLSLLRELQRDLKASRDRSQRHRLYTKCLTTVERFIDQSANGVAELQRQALMIRSLRETKAGLSIDLVPTLGRCIQKNVVRRIQETQAAESLGWDYSRIEERPSYRASGPGYRYPVWANPCQEET